MMEMADDSSTHMMMLGQPEPLEPGMGVAPVVAPSQIKTNRHALSIVTTSLK